MKFQARDLKTLQPLQASTTAKVNVVSN
jgi:hypothetical protein